MQKIFLFCTLIASFSLTPSLQAQTASFEQRSQVISVRTVDLKVLLDQTTVLCSQADYGAEFLKILITDLAKLTLLDHRNRGAGAPCIGAGMCSQFPGDQLPLPGDILDTAQPYANIQLEIKLTRLSDIDQVKKTCQATLVEELKSKVRGLNFFHRRQADLGQRHF